MKKNILVVVAHPDDEVLGVGGACAWHASKGDDVFVLILADGEKARGPVSSNTISRRKQAAQYAGEVLGTKEVFFADFPDNQMDNVPLLDIIKIVENHIQKLKPDILYTHFGGDLNKDHQLVFEAVMTASRPIEGNNYPKEIYCFETLSSTEWGLGNAFKPNTYINIEAVFEKKQAALRCYESEMRLFPHPRSYEAIEALSKLRGSEAGLARAEAFICVRKIMDL